MASPQPTLDRLESHCPVPQTHRRLLDAHNLWHQAAENYGNPDLFRTNLNATIQALRNITFALQSEKHTFHDFDAWYTPWQTRMRASRVLTWVKDARNTVVKQGDLDTASTATVRLLTWKDDELACIPVPPDTSSEALLKNSPILERITKARIPDGDLADALIEIERQWSLPEFQDREVLDILAAAYGLLSDLVVDAHTQLQRLECIDQASPHPCFRATHHRAGTLPCMTATMHLRKERFHLSTGGQLVASPLKPPKEGPSPAAAAARYGIQGADLAATWRQTAPDLVAERVVYWSKRILRRDRFHIRMVFVRDGGGRWQAMVFYASSRSEKHLVVRMVAEFVEQTGADAIIDVGEAWYLPPSMSQRTQAIRPPKTTRVVRSLEDVPGRQEALHVLAATRDGLLRSYTTPFSRGLLGGIKLDVTRISDGEPRKWFYLQPVFKVWATQGTQTNAKGDRVRWLWEPDPLDRCYCGGKGRFGTCCRPPLQQYKMVELQRLGNDARDRSDLAEAERYIRAALARYVIWIRSHTAPTRNVADDLHRGLVGVDVPALEALVDQLERVLEAAGRRAELVPRLRHISETIGVPEASIRLTALAARTLYELGTRADAAAELDRLGDLDELSDATALRVAARVFDGDKEECCRLLLRALPHAENEMDRCFIELDLANAYRRRGEDASALELANGIVERTREQADLTMVRATAFELRWRLAGDASDFQTAKRDLEGIEDSRARFRLLMMLIDHGDLDDADRFLAKEQAAGDIGAVFLAIDIRLKTNRIQEAEELLRGIPADHIAPQLRLPYAHTAGLVALHSKRAELAYTASAMLRCIEAEEGGLPVEYEAVLEGLDALRG